VIPRRHAFEKLIPRTDTEPHRYVLDEDKARASWASAKVDASGVVRWQSNDAVPFDDALDDFLSLGFRLDKVACQQARAKDTEASIENYKRQQRNRRPSAEEQLEMRAAFGPGAVVVNVLTGQKYRT
jgi:hypothetical protein